MKDLTDPTNRDTVPAMLTPGEFVLNKEASQMYAPYIEQMNNHGLQVRQQKNMGGAISPDTIVNGKFNSSHVPTILPPQYNTGGLVDFLKEHEGYRDKAYQDQAGVWTIGYGRTRNPDGSAIKPSQTTNKKKEDSWLSERAASDRSATEAYGKKHGYDWNDNQVDALASFRYNIGNLDQLTDGGTRGMEEITMMLPEYNKAGGQVSKGLQNRRNAELDLFQQAGGGVPQMREAPPQQEEVRPLQFARAAEQKQQSFGDAFAAARAAQGAGGVFEHGGQQYTTDRADDEFNMGGRIPGYNIGGWLSGLFKPDEERMAELQGVADRQADMEMLNSTNTQAADQYGQQVPPPQNDLPIPNSDESLLQGSSQSVDQAKREFVPQAMPGQQVQGGFGAGIPEQFAGGAMPPSSAIENMKGGQSVAPVNMNPPVPEDWDPRYDGGAGPEGFDPGALVNNALDNAGQDTYIEPETYTTPEGEYGGPIPEQAGIPLDNNPLGSQFAGYAGEYDAETGGLKGDVVKPTLEEVANSVFQNPESTEEEIKAAQTIYDESKSESAKGEAAQLLMGEPAAVEDVKGGEAQLHNPLSKENAPITKQAVTDIITAQEAEPLNEKEANDAQVAGKSATPEQVAKGEGAVKEAFGDLFDKKELARAGLIFAGALLTGMSPQRALAFAGQGYLKRIDGKEAMKAKNATALAKAQAKGAPVIDMTKPEAYVVDGKRVNTFTLESTNAQGVKTKARVLADGTPIPPDSHQNFDTVPGTSEYNKRVHTEAKTYKDTFKELQERFGETKGKDNQTIYATDLTPSKVGANTAKWAIKNGVPPEAVGQVLDNAYAAARNDARNGNKPKNIEAYLNSEYIQTKTGSGALFEGAEPLQVNSLISSLTNASGKDSTTVLQFGRGKWNELGPEGQKSYERRSPEGSTPFMTFMQDIISGEI